MNEQKYEDFVGVINRFIENRLNKSSKMLSWNNPKGETSAKDRIRTLYEDCRKQMKIRMAQHLGDPGKWDQQVLDRHKIAAAVCWAMTRAEPIYVKAGANADDRMANEVCAFLAPLQLLMSFAADDARKAGKETLANYFSSGPALPATEDKVPFTLHVARCLYWRKTKGAECETDIDKWIDPFQLAIMYYMIEFFTSLKAKESASGVMSGEAVQA